MSLWRPVSACGGQCLTGAGQGRRVPAVVLRVVAAAGVLISGLVLVPLLRGRGVRTLARMLLAALGVQLVWRGPAPRPGSLLVANHISWIDVLALLAVAPTRLVAKREVGAWPLIGAVARASGAIFLDRSRPRRLPAAVVQVAATLRAGHSVAVFPEGTTFCGAERGRFRPAVFQAAIDAQAPVVPISIRYGSPAAAFIGDDTLWSSIRRVVAQRGLTVTLVGAPALRPEPGAGRRALARAAQASASIYDLAA
ncbi:1-acyl-sn-glycerol-3-phosphate acyltransferase [Actinoplanes sp. N902-109]|uniref:lysophospholipid acyltransferase family protein n=1 Tax=Actinoplanes sp. (strain N902-109) TaxID=649831 RepID=UPI0003295DA5|nr:lysophospholipid acyltransferase family protein [Actinoplanes sp. N902-109]AGL20700.1 phospholipid/glycerol acyltransferase [Actinoplanes sp. N902-109]